jgi:hypothetical protein
MPLASSPEARPLSRRAKRILAVAGGVLLVVVVGAIAWTALGPGGSGTSANGCIALTIPGSTGGSYLHQCGATAKATCRNAFAHTDRISLLIRPQCRRAGLTTHS